MYCRRKENMREMKGNDKDALTSRKLTVVGSGAIACEDLEIQIGISIWMQCLKRIHLTCKKVKRRD